MYPQDETAGFGPVDTSKSPYARWKTLALKDVLLREGFWKKRVTVSRKNSLYYAFEMLEKAGNFDNLRIAAGLMEGTYRGYVFQDTDIYKWLEAVAWETGKEFDEELSALADAAIGLIETAQRPDGYINSYVQTRESPAPWEDLDFGHELYCAGHLFQAAIAYQRSLGDDRLLTIARRFADHIYSIFGPDKLQKTGGHPQIEMTLVEMFRLTGESWYLELAKFFIDQRGQRVMKGMQSYGPEYHQDHMPVREVSEAAGHSVRQLYLASGVTDLFLESGEQALFDAMQRLFKDITEKKVYITGGVGSRFDGESFGDPYELPSDQGYCETCAAIASLMWSWRMLLASGESCYADQMEQALYNNILASPALDGKHFFYSNPLMVREAKYYRLSTNLPPDEVFVPHERPEWHDCACCPPNVMRLLASLTHYLATYNASGIQIHHFASAEIDAAPTTGRQIKLQMETKYPWQGNIKLRVIKTVSVPWVLSIRIPKWSQQAVVSINGKVVDNPQIEKGYFVLERNWLVDDVLELNLKMEPVFIACNPRVDAIRHSLAIQRGPIVYCLEDRDQELEGRLLDVEIDSESSLLAQWEEGLLDGLMVVKADGHFVDDDIWQESLYQPMTASPTRTTHPTQLFAIPYYAWANRGIGGMRVWIPKKWDGS